METDQWNRIEAPEINPCTNSQPIFDKVAKNTHWSLFNKCWKNWIFTCKKMKLDLYLIHLTRVNLKVVQDDNIGRP